MGEEGVVGGPEKRSSYPEKYSNRKSNNQPGRSPEEELLIPDH